MNVKNGKGKAMINRVEAEQLEAELKQARLVAVHELPPDVVRLNSHVTVRDEKAEKVMELISVTPEKADIWQRKVLILSPIASALIGSQKGNKGNWQVPAGRKTFTFMNVRFPF